MVSVPAGLASEPIANGTTEPIHRWHNSHSLAKFMEDLASTLDDRTDGDLEFMVQADSFRGKRLPLDSGFSSLRRDWQISKF